jgi:hypothetical protein
LDINAPQLAALISGSFLDGHSPEVLKTKLQTNLSLKKVKDPGHTKMQGQVNDPQKDSKEKDRTNYNDGRSIDFLFPRPGHLPHFQFNIVQKLFDQGWFKVI